MVNLSWRLIMLGKIIKLISSSSLQDRYHLPETLVNISSTTKLRVMFLKSSCKIIMSLLDSLKVGSNGLEGVRLTCLSFTR